VIDRHDLTDSEWAQLEPLLPDFTAARRGGQWLDHRQVINGVLWRTGTGSPWRDLPGGVRQLEDRVHATPPLVDGRDLGAGAG
jgi:transposase